MGGLLLLLLSPTASAAERVVDRLAAVVNDEVITLSDVYLRGRAFIENQCGEAGAPPDCRDQLEAEILDTLVLLELERQELARQGRDVGEREIDRAIEQTVQQYGFADRDALRDEVEKQGFGWEVYRQLQIVDPLRREAFAQLVLRTRVSITEDELRDQYQRLLRGLEPETRVRLSAFGYVIPDSGPGALVEAVGRVREAIVAIRAGQRTWEDAVAELDTAGLGPIFAGQSLALPDLRENLRKAVAATAEGALAEPIAADGVVYGLRVDAREQIQTDAVSFEQARPQLENEIFARKMSDAEEEWYALARRRASIQWFLDVPQPTLLDTGRERARPGAEVEEPASAEPATPPADEAGSTEEAAAAPAAPGEDEPADEGQAAPADGTPADDAPATSGDAEPGEDAPPAP